MKLKKLPLSLGKEWEPVFISLQWSFVFLNACIVMVLNKKWYDKFNNSPIKGKLYIKWARSWVDGQRPYHYKRFLFVWVCGESHLAVLRAYYRLCIWGLYLVGFGKKYGVLGIEPGSTAWKASVHCITSQKFPIISVIKYSNISRLIEK